jgi:hypothetical protein
LEQTRCLLLVCLATGFLMTTPSHQESLLRKLLPVNETIQRRFAPFSKLSSLQTNLANTFDVKHQLNQLYDKFQPLWGSKNSPKSFGSVIAEISSTQPGAESMTSYTVPGSGITHIKKENDNSVPVSPVSSSSSSSDTSSKLDTLSSSLFTNSDDDDKIVSSAPTSRSKRYFPDVPVSDHPVRTYRNRDRERDRYRDDDRDHDGDRDYPRERRRRRRPRKRYRAAQHDNDNRGLDSSPYPIPISPYNFMANMHQHVPFNINSPFGPFGPNPALFGTKMADPNSSIQNRPDINNNRMGSESSSSRQTASLSPSSSSSSSSPHQSAPPNMQLPFPFPLMFPPGMPGMPPLPLPAMIPGMPPPFIQPFPGMNPFAPFPMMMALQTTTTTTTTPAPTRKAKAVPPPSTSIEDDGSITIAGIRPQQIVNKITDVVRQTGMNKVINSAISSVFSQVKDAGTSVANQVAKNIGDSMTLSLVSDGDNDRSGSGSSSSSLRLNKSPAPKVVKLGEAKISFKPTNSGLSISFGKA